MAPDDGRARCRRARTIDHQEDGMRRVVILAFAAASLLAVIAAPLVAGDGARRFEARLEGFSEVPAVSTTARGSFTARLIDNGTALSFKVTYRDLSGPPTQSHIHFGQPGVNGGISIWLCGQQPPATPNNPTQPAVCPTGTSGEFSGVVTAANVLDTASGGNTQGIAAGEFGEVLRAMRAGVTYANIHTAKHPPGEIRGRITRDD
jgi:hypothetical protein